jgi:carbonic anhydrase
VALELDAKRAIAQGTKVALVFDVHNEEKTSCANLCGDLEHDATLLAPPFLGAGAVALAALSGAVRAADPPNRRAPPRNAIAPAMRLKRLMDGNARYAANNPTERDFSRKPRTAAQAQYPIASILSCADSRVVPDLVFDQSPGDLFVNRVAGNIMTTNLLASLEYGVQFLGTPLILVLGHSNCGAVDAAIQVVKSDAKLPGHLPELIQAIKPAVITAAKVAPNDLLNYAIATTCAARSRDSRARRPSCRRPTATRRSTSPAAYTTSPPARSRWSRARVVGRGLRRVRRRRFSRGSPRGRSAWVAFGGDGHDRRGPGTAAPGS